MALGVILVGEMDTLHGSDHEDIAYYLMTVVEVVGVSLTGKLPWERRFNRHTFASAARGLSGLLVITINSCLAPNPREIYQFHQFTCLS